MIYVVMGGQFGSEGKGEFVAYLASYLYKKGTLGAVVRVGGPNSGHTMTIRDKGLKTYKMRQLPCVWHLPWPGVPLFLGPGSIIDLDLLETEILMVVARGRICIPEVDGSAIILTKEDKEREKSLVKSIGSTGSGTGSARANQVMRVAKRVTDLDRTEISRRGFCLEDVSEVLNQIYDSGEDIIIESSQGFDLSLHFGHYPKVTSIDITPGQILSDAGLSSRLEHKVIAVVRTFPIRVAGNSGPLVGELSWEDFPEVIPERTTVTNGIRRIGRFDEDQVIRMARICRPDYICLTFLDYLYPELKDQKAGDLIWSKSKFFIDNLEAITSTEVRWLSIGPGTILDLREIWGD